MRASERHCLYTVTIGGKSESPPLAGRKVIRGQCGICQDQDLDVVAPVEQVRTSGGVSANLDFRRQAFAEAFSNEESRRVVAGVRSAAADDPNPWRS